MSRLLIVIASLVIGGLILLGVSVRAEPVTFKTADGVTIYGDAVPAEGAAKGVILLFHQAGSNRREYAPIAPRLAHLGWASLAIDQRSGGDLFGGRNETAAQAGGAPSYQAALPDLEATLAYARTNWSGKPVLAWGSSYSAALVFILAARHPGDLDGVLAFSPGEYLSGLSVAGAAAKVTVPLYITSAADQSEAQAAEDILNQSPAVMKIQYIPARGTHGSSTLREDRDPAGYAQNWRSVEAFLARLPAQPQSGTR